jgi:integrase
VSWGHTRRNLVEFFGADRTIGSITSAEADKWAARLAGHEQLAENTVRKRSANAKMFFRVAARRWHIATNPFADLVGSVIPSRGRQYFIPKQTVTALLDQCHGPEFRLLLLFARYMGVRIPSEIVPLKWGDVDWENHRVLITSPKTERHPGGARRVCPIFPEVFPALQDAFDTAPEGEVYVFPSVRSGEKNLRTWLKRAIGKAGLTPWPRLWQNFRAIRSTQLADLFTSHVAAAWLGHTEKIADGHYRQVTADHFRRATTEPAGPRTQPEILAQNPAHSPHVKPHHDSSRNEKTPVFQGSDVRRDTLTSEQMGDEGLEPPTSTL